MALDWSWSAEEVLEELEETLPDALSDDSKFNDSLEDDSLPLLEKIQIYPHQMPQ